MKPIAHIRTFKTAHFRVIVDCLPEDSPIDIDDDGETARKVDSGEFWHFVARVRVLAEGTEIGTDYLGGCIYETPAAFMDHRECGVQNRESAAKGEKGRCGSYFRDMISNAIKEARQYVASLPKLRHA